MRAARKHDGIPFIRPLVDNGIVVLKHGNYAWRGCGFEAGN